MRHHDYKEFYVLTNLMHVNCAYLDLLLPVLFILVITAQQILYSIFFQYSNCLIAFCYNITFLFCNIPDRYPNGIAFVCLLFFVLFENISLIKRPWLVKKCKI